MRAWAGAAVSVIALVSFMPATVADSVDDEVVARLPREGDMARYEFHGPLLGLCDWKYDVDHLAMLRRDNATMRWRLEERQMWDGDTYAFAALERSFDAQFCPTESAEGKRYVFALGADIYGELPGPAFARNTANHYSYDHDSVTNVASDLDELSVHGSGCEGDAIGLVLGRTADEARDALLPCVGEDGLGTTLTTGWEDHATFGRTWVARFGSFAGGEGPGLLARYSPEMSMPLEIQSTSHRLADGRVVEEEAAMTLTGWIDGTEPLAPLLGGTPDVPTVSLVEWGRDGPVTRDLDPFPIREARRALAETSTGDDFFAAHPEATLHHARYSTIYGSSDRRFYGEEVECRQGSAAEQTGGAPLLDSRVRWLRTHWADAASSLYGHTQAPGALIDAGIDAAFSEPDPATGTGQPAPPDRGPQWQDLLVASQLVANMGASGRLVVTMTSPSLPTLAWDIGTDVPLVPRLPDGGDTFTGTVGMASFCRSGTGIDFDARDQGIAFVDGRLSYAWAMNAGIIYDPTSRVPTWDHPAAAFDTEDRGGLSWLTAAVSLAGLGILGLIAIAIKTGLGERIAMSLFSRFQPAEVAGHAMRSKILTQVKAQPGIRLPELAETLGKPRPTLSYHVRMLERHDMVRVSRTWRGLVLHPSGHAGTATAGVLNRANARELLALLDRRPTSDVSSVAAELGIHKSRISRLAQDLEVAGLIVRRRVGRALQLSLSEPGRDLLKASNPQRRQRPSRA